MRTLVIAPHMDDEAISCGGLIARRVKREQGIVRVLSLHGRNYTHEGKVYDQRASDARELEDFRRSAATLGFEGVSETYVEGEPGQVGYYVLLHRIEKELAKFQPHEVVIPSEDDLNQDHQHLSRVCKIVLRPMNLQNVQRVLESVGLDGRLRCPTHFVTLTRSELDVKISAINCYARERREPPSPRAAENVIAQARVWGAASGAQFAEGYTAYLTRE